MKFKNIEKFLIYACIFFIPYTTLKIMGLKLSEIFMIILSIISLPYNLKKKNFKINVKQLPHIKFLFLFSLMIMLSMSVNFIDGTYLKKTGINEGIYYSYEYGWIFKIIRLFLVIYFTNILYQCFIEDEANVRKIGTIYVISTLLIDIVALIALGSRLFTIKFGINRTSLMAVEPSEAGFINAISIIILLYDILIDQKKNISKFIILLIHMLTQIYIGSAAALLFLPVSVCGVVIYRSQKDKKFRKYSLFLIILLIGLLYYLFMYTNVFQKIVDYQDNMDVEGASTIERQTAIETGYEMFKKKPILGFGWGNYGWFVERYKTSSLFRTVGGGFFSANNQYIVILSELGICGSVVFYGFIYQILKAIHEINEMEWNSKQKKNTYIFLTIFTYVMLSNLTLNAIYSYQFWISISGILYLIYYKKEKEMVKGNNENIDYK